jgi:hypothetical protein
MTTKFCATIKLPEVTIGDSPKVLKSYAKTHQPDPDYVGLSAKILNISKQETSWFFFRVGGELTKRPHDEHIYLAVKALPARERTSKDVAIKLAEDFGYTLWQPEFLVIKQEFARLKETFGRKIICNHDYIGVAGELLNLSMVETFKFLDNVEYKLPKRPLYEHFCLAVNAIPAEERTVENVAAKLTEDFGYCVKKPQSFRRPPRPQVIETAVVGISHNGRQEVVERLWSGDEVILRREPNNLYDRNAIMVLRWNGEQIGYIECGLASTLAPKFDAYGKDVKAVFTRTSRSKSYRGGYITWPFIKFTVPE